jgi:hypothetical protein
VAFCGLSVSRCIVSEAFTKWVLGSLGSWVREFGRVFKTCLKGGRILILDLLLSLLQLLHNSTLFCFLFIHSTYILMSQSDAVAVVFGVGTRVKWLTSSWTITCGVVESFMTLSDGTVVYRIRKDGGLMVSLPHSCIIRD